MEIEHALEKLGLSKKECELYLSLVKAGKLSATELSQKTGINRRSVYDSLASLTNLGFVNYAIIEKKKLFRASDFSSLSGLIEEKKSIVNFLKPELERISSTEEKSPIVEIYSGLKAIKGIFEKILKKKEVIYIYGGSMPAKGLFKIYYIQWTKKRHKKGIKIKGIFIDSLETKKFVKSLPLTTAKFIEKELFSPAFWWLQGKNVYLVFFQQTPTIVSIESKELAKTYLHSFNLLWKKI